VRGYVELPTGSGKTVIAAALAALHWVQHLSPVLFLAHRRELVLQQRDELGRITHYDPDGRLQGVRSPCSDCRGQHTNARSSGNATQLQTGTGPE
jgi:superfamily II DNA or RNA helicase